MVPPSQFATPQGHSAGACQPRQPYNIQNPPPPRWATASATAPLRWENPSAITAHLIVKSKSGKMDTPEEVPTSTLPGHSKRVDTCIFTKQQYKKQSGPILQTEGAGNLLLPTNDDEKEK